MFFTLATRVETLRQKYRGGLRAFVEKHNALCNKKLALLCQMAARYLDKAVSDLENNGLVYGEDFVCFDATTIATFYDQGQEVNLDVNWLKGFIQNHDMKVYCSG